MCVGISYSVLDKNYYREGFDFPHMIAYIYNSVVELLNGVDPPDKKTPGQKCIFISWSAFVLIVISVYTANLAAIFSATDKVYDIQNVEQCVAKHCTICAGQSNVLETEVKAKHPRLILNATYTDLQIMLDDLSNGNCDALLPSDLKWSLSSNNWGDCGYVFLGNQKVSYKSVFPVSDTYAKALSYWIAKLGDDKRFRHYLQKYQGPQTCDVFEEILVQDDDGVESVGIMDMLGPILLVASGILLGFVIQHFESTADTRHVHYIDL